MTVKTANFFFHGLFPDHIEANEGTGKQVCKITISFAFISGLMAS